jgi:hypothetical protein
MLRPILNKSCKLGGVTIFSSQHMVCTESGISPTLSGKDGLLKQCSVKRFEGRMGSATSCELLQSSVDKHGGSTGNCTRGFALQYSMQRFDGRAGSLVTLFPLQFNIFNVSGSVGKCVKSFTPQSSVDRFWGKKGNAVKRLPWQ